MIHIAKKPKIRPRTHRGSQTDWVRANPEAQPEGGLVATRTHTAPRQAGYPSGSADVYLVFFTM